MSLAKNRNRLILLALIVLGAALRLWGLGAQGFWRDEAQGLFIALKGFPGGILHALSFDGHPPLYYLIMHIWMAIFGRGEFAIQFFSALCGTAAIPLVYLLGRRLYGAPSGLLAALVAMLLPLQVLESRTARMYALVSLLATVVLYLAYEAQSRGGWGRHVALALASLALTYSHNWGLLLVVAINAWWAVLVVLRLVGWGDWGADEGAANGVWGRLSSLPVLVGKGRDAQTRASLPQIVRACLPWIATMAGYALCYLPWLPTLQAQRSALVVAATWTDVGSRAGNLMRLMNELTGLALPDGRTFVWAILLIVGILGVRLSRKEAGISLRLDPATLLVGCGLALPLVLGLIVTPKSIGIIPAYVTLVAFPALCLGLGRGALNLRYRWAVGLAIAVMLVLWAPGLRAVETDVTGDLREVAAYVQANAAPDDVIIVAPDYIATTFNFYYRGPQPQVAFPQQPGRGEEIIWAEYNTRWARAAERIAPTVQYVEQTLPAGGRVWLVGPVESYKGNPMFEQIRALKAQLDARFPLQEHVTRFRGPVETADVYVYGK
jgi:mannosyltransferase